MLIVVIVLNVIVVIVRNVIVVNMDIQNFPVLMEVK